MKFNLEEDINSVLNTYPKLRYIKEGKIKYLTGCIDLFDADDTYCDSFNIKLSIPSNYPNSFPKLYELENKIKLIDNSHINKDESCCVCSLQEEGIRLKRNGIAIKSYLKEFAIPFLANILYYKEKGKYANGEYKHGFDGVVQYYQELFNKKDVEEVLIEITNTITIKSSRNDKCFCGSDLKYKRCHLKFNQELSKLSKKRLLDDYKIMEYYMQKKNGNIK